MLAYQVCECTRSAPAQSAGHRQVDARASAAAALAAASSGRSAYAGRARPRRAGAPKRPHPHVDVAAAAQRPHQLGDVHPGAAVDLRRVLLGQDVDAHVRQR